MNESKNRATINRANAQRSTGPRTIEGKQRSSLNALRFGFTSQVVVLPGEDLTAYRTLVRRYHHEYKPKGVVEEELVQAIVDTAWRLRRLAAIENNLLVLGAFEREDKISTGHPEADTALATADAYHDHSRTLANLSMHDQRLTRKLSLTRKMLEETQASRRKAESYDLEQASKLMYMHEQQQKQAVEEGRIERPAPYQPRRDGFVFSVAEIEEHVDRNYRRNRARALTANLELKAS